MQNRADKQATIALLEQAGFTEVKVEWSVPECILVSAKTESLSILEKKLRALSESLSMKYEGTESTFAGTNIVSNDHERSRSIVITRYRGLAEMHIELSDHAAAV